MLPVIGGAIQAGSALARKQTYDERRALAVRIAFGKHRILRIAHFARLRFAAAQVFAQFCRHSLFPRHILVFFVSHATRHADNARDAQAWLDIRIAHDNRPRLPSHVIARDGMCCCSSVVERTLGKGEVGSSILPSSTIIAQGAIMVFCFRLKRRRLHPQSWLSSPLTGLRTRVCACGLQVAARSIPSLIV